MSNVLLLDIGNTRTKWVYTNLENSSSISFEENSGAIAHTDIGSHSENSRELIQSSLGNSFSPNHIVCVSVAGPHITEQWQKVCHSLWPDSKWIAFESSKSSCGVTNHYELPNSLGADRWAAIIGARKNYPNQSLLIVNAGTATTIDYVDSQGNFQGGWIIPGLRMMLESLATGTAELPQLNPSAKDSEKLSFGKSTKECITQGCIQSQVGAITRAMKQVAPSCQVILSGGNADFLKIQLSEALDNNHALVVDKQIVLRGLLTWLIQS